MRAKCIKRFRDKETKAVREVGDVFEVTAERFAEISAAQYGPFAEPAPARGRKGARKAAGDTEEQ